MTSETDGQVATSTLDLRWPWVAAGVAIGVVLLGTLVPVVRHETPRPDVAILIGTLTVMLMGILVGYNSPGETVREAAIAGVFLVVLSFLAIGVGFELPITPGLAAGGLIVGLALSALGGWVGEVLQGTFLHEGDAGGLAWPWILVGTVLGIMLNVYTVFVLQIMLNLSPTGVLVGFLISFFVAAFFVGFFSPAVTILEPALAALLVIAADMILVVMGFAPPFPMASVAMAGGAAFVIALGGGYAGEVAHVWHVERAEAAAEALAMAEAEAEAEALAMAEAKAEPEAEDPSEPQGDGQPG